MGRRGRAPCCEKVGLNRGSWTPAEDMKLVAYIQKHGHGNWRALPKRAGLLRCGKSCRLRWINYLRPGIKRGNFTVEEEDTIIRLHEMLGNRWSKIASRLPGRTDNEIKNVFNTHLKKRLAAKDQRSSSAEYGCGAPPASPSSVSNCSPPDLPMPAEDETSGVPGEKRDVIEIPVEAHSDVWDLLEAAGSPPPAGAAATPAGRAESIDRLLDVEPDLYWNFFDESAPLLDETAGGREPRSGPGEDDVLDDRWVAYLEKELDLPESPPSNGIVPHAIPTEEDGGGGDGPRPWQYHHTAPNETRHTVKTSWSP